MKMKSYMIFLVCLLLVACGGGGGDGSAKKWVMSILEYDNNVDGVYEDIGYVTNDSNGYMIKLEIDDLRDGTIDRIGTYVNDAQGYMIQYSWDSDADGTVDNTCTRTNDSNGNTIYEECYKNIDGQIYRTTTFINTYDSNNRIISAVAISNDNYSTRSYYYEYDENGNLSYRKYDSNSDGIIDYIIKYTWVKVDISASAISYNNYGNLEVEVTGGIEKNPIQRWGMQHGPRFIDEYVIH